MEDKLLGNTNSIKITRALKYAFGGSYAIMYRVCKHLVKPGALGPEFGIIISIRLGAVVLVVV